MTIDEAIRHSVDAAKRFERFVEDSHDGRRIEECLKSAAELRQVVEWLKELKERREADDKSVKRCKMSEITLDEVIKSCLKLAEENEMYADKCLSVYGEGNGIIKACRECAEYHRQLAEWLKELKERREADNEND